MAVALERATLIARGARVLLERDGAADERHETLVYHRGDFFDPTPKR